MNGNKIEDWKELLDESDQEILAQLLDSTKNHKCAFTHAEDVKVAQLWCALIEMKREMGKLCELVARVEQPFRAIVEIGEVEKKRAIDRMVREILKPEPEHEEQTKRLVESLMKF